MRDWIYGFFMAWGMFLAIPCPKKIWSETARRKMLACLPFVGIVVGAVWALCAWLAWYLPHPLGAALCAAAPWLVTGFLHLDGFMDVCDGILSRRDLETRRRILKDSHCGAFAVICMVLLAMAQWSAFLSVENVPLLPLALVPVASRAAAAAAVLTLRPMSTSQYSAMVRGMEKLPEQMAQILQHTEEIQEIAKACAKSEDVFFIGRNLDYALSLEGSLKLKEISYI
ncbi:MAG: hypothetical protein EGR26_00065, partial [Clostridiales bacterium]|nr:hypothetical protein [Clostridiales bacterium]